MVVLSTQKSKTNGTVYTMIAALVRQLLKDEKLSGAFLSALDVIDRASATSSISLRQPLARIVVSNRVLLQRNFRRHSVGERATSETLQGVAATLKPIPLRDEMLAHSEDEMRHSKLFAALADRLEKTTGVADQENYDWILENDRKFVEQYNGDVVQFLCDVLASEVRTYSFIAGYLDALEQDPADDARRITAVLQRVLEDECRHVGYAARYISKWMGEGLDLTTSMQRSFENFDRNSWVEVASTAQFLYASPARSPGTTFSREGSIGGPS
jgi:hypothetical protein